MGAYRNNRHKFEIEIPHGWHEPGFFSRLFGLDTNPEFYGPDQTGLKFAIGSISPEPSVKRQQENLKRIAIKHGHLVEEVGSIDVCAKEHATIICGIPSPHHPSHMTLKNYSIIFNGTEYLATALLDNHPEESYDRIIKTFKLI